VVMMPFKNAEKTRASPIFGTNAAYALMLSACRNDGPALTLAGLPHLPPLHYSVWNEIGWPTSCPRPALLFKPEIRNLLNEDVIGNHPS